MKNNLPIHPLLALRRANKLKQTDFSEFELSQSMISRIEKGERQLQIDDAKKIAAKYNVTMQDLLGSGNIGNIQYQAINSYPVELPFFTTKVSKEAIDDYLNGEFEKSTIYVVSEAGVTYADSVIIADNGTRYVGTMVDSMEYKYMTGLIAIVYASSLVVRRIRNNELGSNQTLTIHNSDSNEGTFVLNEKDIKMMVKLTKVVWADVK